MGDETRAGRVALVTGANQGLGFAIVKRLCETLDTGDVVYLTARNEEKGRAAVSRIGSVTAQIKFEPLDVADDRSVAACAEAIAQRQGGVDIVISNAAARISRDVPAERQVGEFINTNDHGTCRMLRHFLPLLNRGARFVIVASSFGSLRHLPEELHGRFPIDSMSLEDVERVMDDYVTAVQSGRAASEGWPDWINIPSKVGQVASAKVAARLVSEQRPADGILVNAAGPGLVDTAASRPWFEDMSGAQSPDDAAVDVVWLATLPHGSAGPQGDLVQFRKTLPWR